MEAISKEEIKRTLNRIMENPVVVVRVKIDGKFQNKEITDIRYDKEKNQVILKTE